MNHDMAIDMKTMTFEKDFLSKSNQEIYSILKLFYLKAKHHPFFINLKMYFVFCLSK